MNDQDTDRLLEQSLGGDPPNQVFRARVLLDSTAALHRARRSRARWRFAALSAAAVLLATVSFLLGRCSVPANVPGPAAQTPVAEAAGTVSVPGELVEWLQAARFFRQLGMDDRVALAYEHASRLVPYDSTGSSPAQEVAVAGMMLRRQQESERSHPAVTRPAPSPERIQSIIAQSFGG